MLKDVSAVCYLEPVFASARLPQWFVSKDLTLNITIKTKLI